MIKGHADEIASLTGLSEDTAETALASLQEKRMVEYKIGTRILPEQVASCAARPDFHCGT